MADNIDITPGSGKTVATDEVASVHHQLVKVEFGVDGSATMVSSSNPLPVVQTGSPALPSGAATAAKQPALGTAGSASSDVITVQGIASMTALKVDNSAVTQPISAASLPLPSGASTAAKQPALGTAGTASADVLTVQGIASMTALKVDGSAVTQPISAASLPLPTSAATDASLTETHGTKAAGTAATKSELIGGLYNTTLPTLTNGQQAAIQVDSSGRLLTSVAAIAAGSTIIGKVGIDQTTDGTTNKVAADLRLAGTAVTAGAGAVASGTPRITLASDDPAVTAIGATNTKLNGGLPAALATGGGLKVTVQDTSGTALDYTVPALVEGGTAHDAAMSTRKPVAVGGLAKTALPTAVSDGDISHLMLDRMGRVIARAVLEESLGDLTTDVTTGPTNIVAADASNKNRLYGLVLANTNTTNSVKCVVKDDTTTRLTFQIPAGETRGFMVPPDAGMAQAAVNKAWTLTNTGTSPTVTATALFVKGGA